MRPPGPRRPPEPDGIFGPPTPLLAALTGRGAPAPALTGDSRARLAVLPSAASAPRADNPEPGTWLPRGIVLACAARYRFFPSICHSVKGLRTPRTFTSMQ